MNFARLVSPLVRLALVGAVGIALALPSAAGATPEKCQDAIANSASKYFKGAGGEPDAATSSESSRTPRSAANRSWTQ